MKLRIVLSAKYLKYLAFLFILSLLFWYTVFMNTFSDPIKIIEQISFDSVKNIADFGAVIMPLYALTYKFGRDLTNDEIREFYVQC